MSVSTDRCSFSFQPQLEIREIRGSIVVPGLTQIEVTNLDEVLEVLWIGAQTRSVCATDMNDYSSRSHTIFQINIQVITENEMEMRQSKLLLVDLGTIAPFSKILYVLMRPPILSFLVPCLPTGLID